MVDSTLPLPRRRDLLFKMALERLPSGRDLCSQATISHLENRPDTRALLRMGHALVDLYCGSFRQVPRRIVLDIDDTFDAAHGGTAAGAVGDVSLAGMQPAQFADGYEVGIVTHRQGGRTWAFVF